VDHHDDAYAWARNRKCSVHPETGSLQVFEVQETVREAEQSPAPEAVPPLFEGVKEKYLLRMGVPSELLPAVREIRSEEELNRLAQSLPREAGDALSLLHLGFSPEEILQDLELKKPDAKVDTEDFAKALQTDQSRSRFFVAEDDLELQAILQAPLEKWRVFLHPTQRKIVEKDWNGPVRVLGGAGTGKTVAAVHRARWLVQSVLKDPNERVLFTTFTVNLAEDIRSNLAKLCSDDVMKRIEVINLDRWVSQFLKARGYEMKLLFDDEKRRDFWGRAMAYKPVDIDLPESFWIEEWEKVIQPQEITGEKEYFQADRKGRGASLDRKQRKAVWPVFEEYRALLSENGYSEPDDAMRDARKLLESSGEKLPYRSIVVDEAQDLGPLAFKLIRRMVPEGNNDIFIVGDAHQRIYKRRTVLSRCGIEVRGRSRKLRINYRTTEETKEWAVALLEGRDFDDLDGGRDSQKGYRSLLRGQPPRLEGFPSFEDEAGFLAAYLNELQASGEPLRNICLVARTNSLLEQYRSALKAK
ncbi:MAG TPA: AAA family ATPase, partial [Synergistales bacterium]|nr:AAA family ATPase [Synergistales bacterium]